MHQRKSKKILIYFFLLLLVGSINNIDLDNLKFERIKDIKVVGLGINSNSILKQNIVNLDLDNIFFISEAKITNQINSNSLVEKYNIFKRYPSSLHIKIDKTKFLARMNKNGKIFILGSNGKLSKSNFSNKTLPFIFGKPEINEFLNFKKILDQSKFSYDDIKDMYFFSSKRWDLELNNSIVLKLSKNHVAESLDLAFEFLNNKNFKHIKIVDARIKNQIILND